MIPDLSRIDFNKSDLIDRMIRAEVECNICKAMQEFYHQRYMKNIVERDDLAKQINKYPFDPEALIVSNL